MDDVIKFLQGKAAIYSVMAFPFYKEADEEYVNKLQSMLPVFKAFLEIHENNDKLSEGIEFLEKFLNGDESKNFEFLKTEFARLFLIKSISQNIDGVVPTESVYLSPTGLIMQQERDEVLEAYYDSGMCKSDNFKESEDHISAELSFLAGLNKSAAEALEKNDSEEAEKLQARAAEFLSSHLMKWLPKVTEDIVGMTESAYFKAAALITLGVAQADAAYMGVL